MSEVGKGKILIVPPKVIVTRRTGTAAFHHIWGDPFLEDVFTHSETSVLIVARKNAKSAHSSRFCFWLSLDRTHCEAQGFRAGVHHVSLSREKATVNWKRQCEAIM